MNEPLMTVKVMISQNDISVLDGPYHKVIMIPFYGEVESEIFSGKIRPGACDVQIVDACGVKKLCAKYMFEGTDGQGNKCHLFIENNASFEKDSNPYPFHATPTFYTDSQYLYDILCRPQYRSEGWGRRDGVDIKIFDITKD